jgi:hypothetical protein
MSAYISTDLNMVKALDQERHRIELAREEYLSRGKVIEVLEGPTMKPPPARHEPPPRPKVVIDTTPKPPTAAAVRQKTRRQKERAERAVERAKERYDLVEHTRKLAETMTYAQAMEATGKSRKVLTAIALEGGFSFQTAAQIGYQNLKPHVVDEAQDAKIAERIKAFKELGLTRNQAREKAGITYPVFMRILDKFDIDYPKRRAGPHPAFFAKQQ